MVKKKQREMLDNCLDVRLSKPGYGIRPPYSSCTVALENRGGTNHFETAAGLSWFFSSRERAKFIKFSFSCFFGLGGAELQYELPLVQGRERLSYV